MTNTEWTAHEELVPGGRTGGPDGGDLSRLHDVPIELSVEIGRTVMTLGQALRLGPGSIIELRRLAGEPVDLLAGGKRIAHGEVLVVDEEFALRITDMIPGGDESSSGGDEPSAGGVEPSAAADDPSPGADPEGAPGEEDPER